MQLVERAMLWTGGAAFVASLGLCALTYFVAFGRAQPLRGWPPVAADTALFTLFAAHHSLLAREPVKRAVAAAIPAHLLRSVYVWTASLLLVAVCAGWRPI